MTDNTHGQVPAIQRFEVVDCIDDKHVPAVIPKPHGPWVRYEDHIAALAAGQATAAQQPGAAGLIGALKDAQQAINSMKVEAETAAQGDEQMMLEACETISNEGLQADMVIRAALASHGQAYPTIEDLCARIKAADDSAADREYMLDSDDCIAVLRGQWKGPMAMDKPERASYGQAPAQAAPTTQPAPQQAARPVTPYTCPKCRALWLHWPAEQSGFAMDMLNCRSTTHCDYCEKGGVEQLQRLERVPAALAVEMPAPQQEPSCTSVQLAEMVLSDCGHSSNYTPLLDRVAARIDAHVERRLDELRGCLESKKTAQQEAQEPVAVIGAGFTIFWAGHGPIAPIVERHALKVGSPLYAAPQPSPASQEDALDAMRYRWLRINAIGAYRTNDGKGPVSVYHLSKIPAIPGIPEETDAAIDAASAAQEGKKP